MNQVIVTIFFSFLIHIYCYIYVSRKEDNYFNIFFPYMLFNIPVNFIFEPLWIYYYGLSGSVYSYEFIYATFSCVIIAMVIAFRLVRDSYIVKLPFSNPINKNNRKYLAYILFILAFLAYLPVLIEFREYLFSPREIYVRTRTGYGLNFFVSTFLAILSFICFLFYKGATRFKKIIFTTLIVIFVGLHGSKGQILYLFLILALYYVYVRNWKVGVKKFTFISIITSSLVVLTFFLTTTFEYDNIFQLMLSYSDYNRNAMIIIDKYDESFKEGRLTAESNFYARIPRAIMPDKPKDYGEFYLAKKYFPAWYYEDTGSPAFGIGLQYADFGDFSIIYLTIWGFITGLLLKLFINRLKKFRTPGDFIVVLFLSGIMLLPLGSGYLLPEHLFAGFLLNLLLSVKIT